MKTIVSSNLDLLVYRDNVTMLRYIRQRHAYPSDCFFEIAIKEGTDFVVGFDARLPSVFSDEVLCKKAKCFLEMHEITPLDDVILRKI